MKWKLESVVKQPIGSINRRSFASYPIHITSFYFKQKIMSFNDIKQLIYEESFWKSASRLFKKKKL